MSAHTALSPVQDALLTFLLDDEPTLVARARGIATEPLSAEDWFQVSRAYGESAQAGDRCLAYMTERHAERDHADEQPEPLT